LGYNGDIMGMGKIDNCSFGHLEENLGISSRYHEDAYGDFFLDII